MDSYVDKIVAALFEKAGDTEEVRALREEISDNCREHFHDLLAQGLSPEEAARKISESLKGIEEVIDELARSAEDGEKTANDLTSDTPPRREGIALEKAPDNDETICESATRMGEIMDFDADAIRRIEFESVSVDLSVEPSPDGALHLIPDTDDGSIVVSTLVREGVLGIKAERREKEGTAVNSSVGATVAELLKKAFSGVSITLGSAELRLLLPVNAPEIGAQTTSGDIRLCGIETPGLQMSSASGDMSISLDGKTGSCILDTRSGDIRFEGSAAAFRANSTSGDMTLRGDFETCSAQSRSGDLNADVSGGRISLATTSGDIELRGRMDSVEVNSTSGDIEATALFTEGAFSSNSGDITLRADDAHLLKRIGVNTVSGDALVYLPEELNARVKFTTVSGESKNNHGGGAIGEASVNLRSVSGDLTVR